MILGGAGFLGSNTAVSMIQNTTYSVISVDNLDGTTDLRNLEPVLRAFDRHKFYLMNIADEQMMSKLFELEKPNVVLCFANASQEEYASFNKTLSSLPYKPRIITISPNVVECEDLTTIKTCNIFGTRQHPSAFIPNLISDFFHDKEFVEIEIDSKHQKEWMYVRDFVLALIQIIKSESPEEYEISSGWIYTETDVANIMSSILGSSMQFEINEDRVSAPTLNSSKLHNMGWRVKHSFEETLEHTIGWYESNKNWVFRV